MPKDTFWFSHDYNARSDRKLIRLRMKHEMEGIGVYWCIIEMLYEEGGVLKTSEYERITYELKTNIDLVKSVINDFDLFKKDTDNFWSESVLARLKIRKEKSDKARESIGYRWGNNTNENTNNIRSYNDSNTIKERKGKEIKEKEILKGVKFSENKEKVFFNDKSSQNLGKDQKALLAMNELKPFDVTKGLIN